MTVCKKHFYSVDKMSQRGASISEVILAVAVVLAVSPFMYTQIINMSNEARDVTKANQIVHLRDNVINFLRMNQNRWDDTVEIKLSAEEIESISPLVHSAFIDKYKVNGATVSDVYLAFTIPESGYSVANIAKQIGEDAAVVREDGVAYSQTWAVTAPDDFFVGDLIYKISRDFDGADKSRFLHRGTMGEDELNKMQRTLHMNNYNIFNVNDINGISAKITDVDAVFLDSDVIDGRVLPYDGPCAKDRGVADQSEGLRHRRTDAGISWWHAGYDSVPANQHEVSRRCRKAESGGTGYGSIRCGN